MALKRILLTSPYGTNDTTSLLRAVGPFSLMRDEVEIVRPRQIDKPWWQDWSEWRGIDVCFLHRPANPTGMAIMQYAKQMGVPLWVDHDDDLLSITPDNPAYLHYTKSNSRESIEYSYKNADILTCSGKLQHKEFVEKYKRSDAVHIDTGIDDQIAELKRPFSLNQKITWRGSKSHQTDLLFFAPQIHEAMIKNKKTHHWFFFGINPYWLDWHGEVTMRWVDELNLYDFLNNMCNTNSSIHMVPLVDTRFNRVKSNLAWLDGTLAGSAVIGPNYEEYDRPGVIQYASPKGFSEALEFAIKGEINLLEKHNESWDYIRENLLTSKLNAKRSEILRNL